MKDFETERAFINTRSSPVGVADLLTVKSIGEEEKHCRACNEEGPCR